MKQSYYLYKHYKRRISVFIKWIPANRWTNKKKYRNNINSARKIYKSKKISYNFKWNVCFLFSVFPSSFDITGTKTDQFFLLCTHFYFNFCCCWFNNSIFRSKNHLVIFFYSKKRTKIKGTVFFFLFWGERENIKIIRDLSEGRATQKKKTETL